MKHKWSVVKKNQSTPLTPYVAYLLFLFRTVAMMLSMISLISVSLLMTWLFKEILTKSSNLTNLSVFLRDPLYKDDNARFTTVPLKLCLIKYEIDFHLFIQIVVSCKLGIFLFGWRVTLNYAYSPFYISKPSFFSRPLCKH